MIYLANNNSYLCHHGVLGMRWGHRKNSNYRSTGIRSAIAKRKNDKVDKGFKLWKENAEKRENAIKLGKNANASRMAYEGDSKNKLLQKKYKQDNKAYKKALRANTTYRKGQIRSEVGSDLSRKYLSEAKKIKNQLKTDSSNSQLKKEYDQLMSKHAVERAKARKAQEVGASRSRKKASIKRGITMSVKALAGTAVVAAGTYAVNSYLSGHNVTLNGNKIRVGTENISNLGKFIKKAKNFTKYIY